MKNFSKKLKSIFVISSCCLLSTIGIQSFTPAVYAATLEEIIVTARKREESLQETPISITTFNSEALEARGISDLSEIGGFTSNLVFDFTSAINPTSSAASIYIRGVGQPDWSLPTDPGVGLYLDGVYIARATGAVLDLAEIESVEVLKGPQGTLFGRNNIGGAISIRAKKPSFEEFEGKIAASYGKFSRHEGKAFFNVPVSDTFAFNAAVSSKRADGFVKNMDPGSPDIGDEDSLSGRLALRFMPHDQLDINITADVTKERETNTANIHPINSENAFLPLVYNGAIPIPGLSRFNFTPSTLCADQSNPARLSDPSCFNSQYTVSKNDPYRTSARFVSYVPEMNTLGSEPIRPAAEIDLFGVSAHVEWAISDDLDLVSITAYREQEGFWARDEDGSPIEIVSTLNDIEQDQFTQEFQLQGRAFDERLNYIFGMFYFQEEGCHLDLVYLYGETLTSGGCIDNGSKAIFAQSSYDFTDQWSLTVGVRHTEDEKGFSPDSVVQRSELVGLPIGSPLLPVGEVRQDVSEVNVNINLSYLWSDSMMTYASYGDGFKGATFTQRIFPNFDFVPTAAPEYVKTYEVGFKSELAESTVRLNGALFFTDYTDIQVTVLEDGNAGNTTANAAEGEIWGGELELTASPTDKLLLESTIGYLNAEYTRVDGIAAVNGLTTDTQFVNTPEWSITSAVSYLSLLDGGWSLTSRVDYSFSSEVYNDAQNSEVIRQGSTGLWSAGFRLNNEQKGWLFSLTGKNLSNELVIISGFSDPGFTGQTEATVLAPRTWLLTAQKSFF